MYETIKCELNEGIATVTVNRPKAMNALNSQVLDELFDAFTTLAANADDLLAPSKREHSPRRATQ